MDCRLTYTSDEEQCVSHERAYIGWSKQSGTMFTVQGVCDKVLSMCCKPNWLTLTPDRNQVIIGCDSMTSSIVHIQDKKIQACCVECLVQAAELLAVCEREKRQK